MRKTTYLVAGILPATFFGIISLFLIMTPALFWTAAAWIGIVGLMRAFNRRPYDVAYGKTALMLICGIAAMTAFLFVIMLSAPSQFEWQGDYAFVLVLLGTVSPILVALHFLYFQTILFMTSWLSALVVNKYSGQPLKPTGAPYQTNA